MESRDRHYRRDSYIEGNVVRQRESVPGRSVQPAEKTREQLHQERMRKNAARQNQQRAMAMDRGYVAFLAAATVVCFLVCAIFIYLQSDVTTRMANIASIESQIAEVKADNDNVAAEKRLETTMNLDQIKEAAKNLGLIMPGSEQVRYYSVENSDYMNQYGEIPSN